MTELQASRSQLKGCFIIESLRKDAEGMYSSQQKTANPECKSNYTFIQRSYTKDSKRNLGLFKRLEALVL